MSSIDWSVLVGSLVSIVAYGLWRGRGSKNLKGYLLADRKMQWYTIALSIMATQASAITFLSAPGQGFTDGVRFVQFYLGLPVAMVVLSVTAVPIYRRLKVFTAYEFLESRFDLKTRTIAAFLFLMQRGLAAGLTIYAPSIILSVLLGWNIYLTNLIIGLLVISYTAWGGAKSVNYTQFAQMLIIIGGMGMAFVMILKAISADTGIIDAAYVAGKLGRLNAIDFSFDLNSRYTFWSGLIGGFFLQLSYFGTDQSQVGRYLTGQTTAQSRLALLFNGIIKIPMQFSILFLGALLFVFYQFIAPPIFFNPIELEKVHSGPYREEMTELEYQYRESFEDKKTKIRGLISAKRAGDDLALTQAVTAVQEAQRESDAIRQQAIDVIHANDPQSQTSDTNYIFLSFVIGFLPVGIIGLVLAAIFAASMSSTAAELNALASTTVIDVYERLLGRKGKERERVIVTRVATLFWGGFAIMFAEYASRLGSLIEAVNILGSLVYGTILGIFMVAFFFKKTSGNAVFVAALVAEVAVILCFFLTDISFLWYNVVGCLTVMIVALLLDQIKPNHRAPMKTAGPA